MIMKSTKLRLTSKVLSTHSDRCLPGHHRTEPSVVAKNTRMNFCFFALLFCLFVCLFKVGNQTGQVENPHPPVYACELLY